MTKISNDFQKSEKELGMHIMNNLCNKYEMLKEIIKQDPDYLNNLDTTKTRIHKYWKKKTRRKYYLAYDIRTF